MNSINSKNQVIIAHGLLIFNQCSGVLLYVLGKTVMQSIPFTTFVIARIVVAISPMILVSILSNRNFRFKRNQILFLLGASIVMWAQQSLFFYGLSLTSATNTAIISASATPVFTLTLSIIRRTDKLTFFNATGTFLSIVGALILLRIEQFKFEGKTIGNLVVLASSFVNSVNTIAQRKSMDDGVPPIIVITTLSFLCIILFIIIYSPFGALAADAWNLSLSLWLSIIATGIMSTALSWSFGAWSLKKTTPASVAIYSVLQPMLSVTAGTLLLGEEFSIRDGLSSILIFFGMFLFNWNTAIKEYLLGKIKLIFKPSGFGKIPQTDLEEEESINLEPLELEDLQFVEKKKFF